MVFHHFLVMTAALVGRPSFDESAHQDIDFLKFASLFALVKNLWIFYQKLLIEHVLRKCPERAIKLIYPDMFFDVLKP